MISLGSVSFYRPRDAGPYFGQEFDLFDGILEFVPLVLIKSFDVNQYAHVPALRLKPITLATTSRPACCSGWSRNSFSEVVSRKTTVSSGRGFDDTSVAVKNVFYFWHGLAHFSSWFWSGSF
jgi:hypothetical protein